MNGSTVMLNPEEQQVINNEIFPLVRKAETLVVRSEEDKALLITDIKSAEELKVKIEEKFHPTANREKALRLWQESKDTENSFYQPIEAFISKAKAAIKGWNTSEALRIQRQQREEQERKEQAEREEKARREAEAKAAQEAEEKRQLEEFERLEAEKKKKLELQKSATESGNAKVAGIAAKEVAKIDAETQRVVDEGAKKISEIQAKAEEPAPSMAKFTPPPAPPRKLIQKARVTNIIKLCRSVADGKVPFNVIDIRQSQLNDFAKMAGNQTIEGIEFYQEASGRI